MKKLKFNARNFIQLVAAATLWGLATALLGAAPFIALLGGVVISLALPPVFDVVKE